MPASVVKSVSRVGSRAMQIARAVPSIMSGSRRTSWVAFEQPNPSKILASPAGRPGDGNPGGSADQPPDPDAIIDALTAQQALLEWIIFAGESEIRRRAYEQQRQIRRLQQQRPYYQLPTTRLCIPDHPATFGCSARARLAPRLDEKPAPVRVWTYDYEVERAVTDKARAKAERERVRAKQQRLKIMFREALREAAVGHD